MLFQGIYLRCGVNACGRIVLLSCCEQLGCKPLILRGVLSRTMDTQFAEASFDPQAFAALVLRSRKVTVELQRISVVLKDLDRELYEEVRDGCLC